MSSALNPTQGAISPLPIESLRFHPMPQLSKEELDRVLRALEDPFDANLVQWRVTEWSHDNTRGLIMTYADPIAYSDRLNGLFTPACWRRKSNQQVSSTIHRIRRPPAAKI